jgi:hypothetical protein
MTDRSNQPLDPQTAVMHIVLFKWHAGTSQTAVDEIATELLTMSAELPVILSYRCGSDLGLSAGAWDFGVTSICRNPEDLQAYLSHPRHRDIVDRLMTPVLDQRIAVDITLHADDVLAAMTGVSIGPAS